MLKIFTDFLQSYKISIKNTFNKLPVTPFHTYHLIYSQPLSRNRISTK